MAGGGNPVRQGLGKALRSRRGNVDREHSFTRKAMGEVRGEEGEKCDGKARCRTIDVCHPASAATLPGPGRRRSTFIRYETWPAAHQNVTPLQDRLISVFQ